jgi:hypothetical protein
MARFVKEAQRKSKVVVGFPDERFALLLVAAKLKHLKYALGIPRVPEHITSERDGRRSYALNSVNGG